MTDGRIATRYAQALFNAALKQDILQSVNDELAAIASAVASNPSFKNFLKDPKTTDEQKLQVFTKTFGDRVTALTMEFVRLLVRKGRDEAIYPISLKFTELLRAHQNVIKALVTSAQQLSADEQKKIVTKIEKQLGGKLDAEFVVDEKLIGGVTVAYGAYVLDGSVRGQLERLREHMIYDLLKQA